jgi:uncharacterized protein YhaN
VKLLGLHLLAYGPFTNVELDLLPEGVHVVYGKNEAGKSTALRAITGLLYGIAKNTPDAHVHKMPDLRVGGNFRIPDGGSVYLVRRKGKDNTLLDREGRPVDEAVLARLLGGVSEEQFLTMFGLDHETLRRGGEALLLGKGHLGESLFGAAVAGGEVHQMLRGLRADADALFTPKAHTRPLNEAIKALTDAHRRVRDASTSPDSVLEQERNLAELKRERADCDGERHRLQIEYTKLQRACRALPIIAKYKLLEERRAALGEVVRLPPDAARERTEQLRTSQESGAEIGRLERLISELTAQREALTIPESLVAYDEVPLELADRLGSHRKASHDLPRIETEAHDLEGDARELLRRLGRVAELHEAEAWRIDAVKQAGIRKLALERTTLGSTREQTMRALEDQRARRAALLTRRESLRPTPDVRALKKAASRAERAGPLDERLATALAQARRIEQRATAQLSALGLSELSLAAAAGLPVVPDETVERFAREFEASERDQTNLGKQASEIDTRAAQLEREIEALELAGKVPTEQDLASVRERRDAGWHNLRRIARTSKPIRIDLLSMYENDVRAADEIADRLRREVERVGKLAALLAEREACSGRRAANAEQGSELRRRREVQADAWRSLWQHLGVRPGTPLEMKAWLSAHASIVRTADEIHSIEAEVSAIRAAMVAHADPIRAELESHGCPAPVGASLGNLLDRAQELVEASEIAVAERRELERDIDEIDAALAVKVSDEREHARAHARVEAAWKVAVAPLAMADDASPEQVTVTIELLAEMFHKIDQAAAARRRAAGIERDAKVFAEDVETLARQHAPDLVGEAPDGTAAAILDRYHRGRRDLVEQKGIDRQLKEATEMLARQRERARAAERSIAELMARARAGTALELEAAERRSVEARELDVQIEALDEELLAMSLSMQSLPDEFRELDADTADARLEEVEAEREQLAQRVSVIDQRIGGNVTGQKQLEAPRAGAAEAALDAEAALATVREIAERYARVRVASVVLAREIERYRQKNQGPILKRASTLFERLTLTSFSGLKTDFDDKDEPILVGVRKDGQELGVEAMSDGTRDQLYLALYLATLERFAEGGDPMPLIVDDVLIHFDDDRARAALAVLGELSEHTQVLFFTHHARLVQLAREAIPTGRLFIRELEPPPPDAN